MKYFYFLIATCFFEIDLHAQIVGTDVYMKGNYIQIGISGAGAFEGANATINPVPPGYNQRPIGTYFGIVANPQLNSWAAPNFDGDFFTPGSPENGWGFEILDGAFNVKGHNNCLSIVNIPGSIVSYTVSASNVVTEWDGNYTGSGYNLDFHFKYNINLVDLYYTTTVTVTNNSTMIDDFYFYRNVDPDNNQSVSGSYVTTNTIMDQPPAPGNRAAVSAKQLTPWVSSMALVAYGPDFRVSKGGFSNRDASDIWNGTGGLIGTLGATSVADEAISLSYRKINFAPGASETFNYYTVFADSLLDADFESIDLVYNGAGTIIDNSGSGDTVYACGSLDITLSGSNLDAYDWSWSPNTYLNVDTGITVTSTPLATITYTITGTPVGLGAVQTFTVTVIPAIDPDISITPPAPQCTSYDLSTLVYTDLNASSSAATFHFDIPANANDMSNVIPSSTVFPPDSVYLMLANAVSGCYDVEYVPIVWENILFDLNVTTTACDTNSGTGLISGVTALPGTYTILWSTGDVTLTVGDLPSGPVSVTLTSLGGCSTTTTDTILQNLISIDLVAIPSGCSLPNGEVNSIVYGDSLNTYSFMWSNGATTADLIGVLSGFYSVTVTNQDGCSDFDTITVTDVASTFTVNNAVFPASCPTCSNGTIYTFLAGSPALPVTYSWSNGATTPNLFGILPGTYTVTVTDAFGCIFTDTFVVTYPTSITDIASEFEMTVFPNPIDEFIQINSSLSMNLIEVFTIEGRMVLTNPVNSTKVNMDLTVLSKGIYTLKVMAGDLTGVIKLIKN
jgi:Secretion system C-terminal sorting domain